MDEFLWRNGGNVGFGNAGIYLLAFLLGVVDFNIRLPILLKKFNNHVFFNLVLDL
jgi:hypothetical protein